MALCSVTGSIVNHTDKDANLVIHNIWPEDVHVVFPQNIPPGDKREFTHNQSGNSLPCGAVVYRINNKDGGLNDAMISWEIISSVSSKIYTEIRDSGGFGDDWVKIKEMLDKSGLNSDNKYNGNVSDTLISPGTTAQLTATFGNT